MTIYEIELNNTYSNQEFDVNINESNINIHVLLQTTEAESLMMSVFVDDEQVGQAFKCYPNQYIIPYKYMAEKLGGNFVFETVGGNYPYYEDFGESCNLYFVTLEETNAE